MATHDPNKPHAPAYAYHPPKVDPLDTHAPHLDEHPEQHEHTDVKIKPLVWTFVALCGLGVVGHGGLYLLHKGFERAQKDANDQERKSAVEIAQRVPPAEVPKLQGVPGVPGYSAKTPVRDMDDWRELEAAKLKQSGPGQRPIGEAIEMALKPGFYKQQAPRGREGQPKGRPGETHPEPPPFRIPGVEPSTEGGETPITPPAETPSDKPAEKPAETPPETLPEDSTEPGTTPPPPGGAEPPTEPAPTPAEQPPPAPTPDPAGDAGGQ